MPAAAAASTTMSIRMIITTSTISMSTNIITTSMSTSTTMSIRMSITTSTICAVSC